MRCDDVDVMMMQKKNKQILIWGKPRDITTDTTNKGSHPEIHDTVGGEKSKVNYRIFSRHVVLLDTNNKRFLLTSMALTIRRDTSKIEPIRIEGRDRPPTKML